MGRKKPKLPPYVTLKFSPPQWHVRLSFPTDRKDFKGRTIYEQMSRRCLPETPEQAALVVESLRAEYERIRAAVVPADVTSLGSYLEYFLTQKQRSVGARTADDYNKLYRAHIKGTPFSERPLTELTPIDVQTFYGSLNASGSAIRKVHVLLSMALTQAVAWEKISRNPAAGAMLPIYERRETVSMTDREVAAIIKICRENDEFIMFDLGLETGLRPQELLAVRWSDIDLSRLKVHVRQAIAFGISGFGDIVKLPKTSKSVRTVEISSEVAARLKVHRANYEKHLNDLRARVEASPLLRSKGVNYQKRKAIQKHAKETLAEYLKNDFVFASSTGGNLALNNVNRRLFKSMLELAGIDPRKYSLKHLRHTNATILAAKVKPNQLQKHLGHEKIETTLTYYVHVDEDRKVNMGQAFAQAVSEAAQ